MDLKVFYWNLKWWSWVKYGNVFEVSHTILPSVFMSLQFYWNRNLFLVLFQCYVFLEILWYGSQIFNFHTQSQDEALQINWDFFIWQSFGCFEGQASRQKRKLGEFKLSFKISIICSNFFGNRSIVLIFSVIVWRISRSISETNKFVLNYFFNAGNFHKHWLSIYKSLLYTFTVSCSSS